MGRGTGGRRFSENARVHGVNRRDVQSHLGITVQGSGPWETVDAWHIFWWLHAPLFGPARARKTRQAAVGLMMPCAQARRLARAPKSFRKQARTNEALQRGRRKPDTQMATLAW